ncbi:POK25 protein, partial [Rissa tridactyla]|nr:POK25 protein [Rissa tridactyla]
RGLKPNQIWQTDFTWYEPFKPRPWLAVSIDTCSGAIIATIHRTTKSREARRHWTLAISVLGVPKQIKTDNGAAFTAKTTQEWCERWEIQLKHGIPYNSTGQAIIE